MAAAADRKILLTTEKKQNIISTKEKEIRDILQKSQQNLPDGVIHAIAYTLAYQQIGDYDKIGYLIDMFKVEFNKNTLHAVVRFRGGFMHTGMGPDDEVRGHYLNTLGILERTLLAMLGWKGNQYIDKLSDFSLKTLN
jgi:hypothetical protein